MLFRYYKGHEKKERWKVIEVSQEASRLEAESTAFATVLAVNEKVPAGESVSEAAKYYGPFYIDIDNSESFASSLKTAKKIVGKLLGNGVPEASISIWASGKKGFHITIPMECFTAGEPVEKLPLIYRQVAMAMQFLDMKDVDATVYSTGKGRMWRLENKKRPDNGKYKVPLTPSELTEIDIDTCLSLMESPRTLERAPNTKRVSFLEAVYRLAKGRADSMEKPKGIFIDPNLKEALDNKLPPCLEDLKHFRNIRDNKGFNDTSLQFGKGVAAFAPEDAKELIQEFADNSHGNTYNTPAKRKSHCFTAFKIAAKNSGYEWSCSSMLSILKDEPCLNCPIAFIRTQQEDDRLSSAQARKVAEEAPPKAKKAKTAPVYNVEDIPLEGCIVEDDEPEAEAEQADPLSLKTDDEAPAGVEAPDSSEPAHEPVGANMEGLLETDQGYCFLDASGQARRISNFTLRIKKQYVEFIPSLETDRRVAVQADVYVGEKCIGPVFLEESNFFSKSGLISAFAGLGNAAFYGKDDDVQKMRGVLMDGVEEKAQTIRRVYACGVHKQQIGDRWVFTYVEPGWSIDQFGNENLYTLSGKITAYPKLKNVKTLHDNDEKVGQILDAMMRVNHSHVLGQVIGWYMASFLVSHIFTFKNEFPLLSLCGEPGSGKSSTASMFAALHGVDYRMENSPVNLPGATAFIVWKTISYSMSVPRLFEEFNKSKIPRMFDYFAEIFKACWNHHAHARGSIKNDKAHGGGGQIGAHVVDVPMTGPVVICSEQEIAMPSLVERMIQIRLSKNEKSKPEFEEPFAFAEQRLEWLLPFAKACYLEVLQVTPDEISEWLEEAAELVPYEISARPRYSYRITFVGLRFMERVLKKHKLPMAAFGKMRDEYKVWITDNREEIATSKKTSEVDQIISKLASMAAMSDTEGQIPWFVAKEHYIRYGDRLYIDPIIAHAMYLRYMSHVERSPPVIENMKEFTNLIRGESYLLNLHETLDGFSRGRPCFVLSISKLKSKGIPSEAFQESS